MKKNFLLLLSMLTVLLSAPTHINAQTQSSLTISPSKQTAAGNTGSFGTFALAVTNDSNVTVTSEISFRGFKPSDDGTPLLLSGDEKSDFDSSSWFRPLAPVTIGAKQTKIVNATYDIPENARNQTYYSMAIVSPQGGSDASLSASVGALMFITIGPSSAKGTIANLKVDSNGTPAQQKAKLSLTIDNGGNYMFEPKITYIVKDASTGEVAHEYDPRLTGSILPQSSRTYVSEYNLPVGLVGTDYTITPTVKDEAGNALAGSRETALFGNPTIVNPEEDSYKKTVANTDDALVKLERSIYDRYIKTMIFIVLLPLLLITTGLVISYKKRHKETNVGTMSTVASQAILNPTETTIKPDTIATPDNSEENRG